MDIIYFSTEAGVGKDPLLHALRRRFPDVDIEEHSKPGRLRARLESLRTYSNRIVILVAPTEEVLIDIYSMHHLLHTVSSILILPDSEAHTVALGQRTRANFLLYVDTGKDDVLSAVEELIDSTSSTIAFNGLRKHVPADDYRDLAFYDQDKVSNL